jgi:hypothetical protein
VDILALLGEDVGLYALLYHAVSALDLPVCMRVGYRGPVHPDVAVITEIQENFPSELSVVIGDDGVGDPEMENDVRDEIHYLLGANLRQGPHVDPLSELVDRDKQVGQAPRRFFEGSQKVQAPHSKQPCNGHYL